MSGPPRLSAALACAVVASLLAAGCASSSGAGGYDYFGRPGRRDPWSLQILRWQVRASEDVSAAGTGLASVVGVAAPSQPLEAEAGEALRDRYLHFVAERKLALAREIATWSQKQGARFYVSDDGIDHWPTLREILARNGDDCDGLELLNYYLLRELGFEHVFRAVVWRPSDGQHHMVTLWFETRDDPRVIDPTGAMTTGAPRMSQIRGWVPLKVFDERREYTVRRDRSRR